MSCMNCSTSNCHPWASIKKYKLIKDLSQLINFQNNLFNICNKYFYLDVSYGFTIHKEIWKLLSLNVWSFEMEIMRNKWWRRGGSDVADRLNDVRLMPLLCGGKSPKVDLMLQQFSFSIWETSSARIRDINLLHPNNWDKSDGGSPSGHCLKSKHDLGSGPKQYQMKNWHLTTLIAVVQVISALLTIMTNSHNAKLK